MGKLVLGIVGVYIAITKYQYIKGYRKGMLDSRKINKKGW